MRRIKTSQDNMPTISYDGNYECWEDAIAESKGYQDMEILNKNFINHANSDIGLKTVKVLDAVYRSIKSEKVEQV